jgi:hypothetical protein
VTVSSVTQEKSFIVPVCETARLAAAQIVQPYIIRRTSKPMPKDGRGG